MHRPVGPGCSSGVSDRVVGATTSTPPPNASPFPQERDGISRPGDSKHGQERSHITGGEPTRWLPVHHLSSSKERWGPQTPNQPQRIHPSPSFQDGGYPHAERSPETRGFHGKDRSERRIFRGPNKQIRPKIPEVQVERQDISVQLPAFWTVMCSLGLYQDNQGRNSSLERDGHQAHHLHR